MKAKSIKLITIVALHALYKHTDAEHRFNTPKLNKLLEPYGLKCTWRVLKDTVKALREFGVDVRTPGVRNLNGVWIEDRPLSDPYLNRLIFAVTTNPHISKTQATDILSCLKPVVTDYQEDKLVGVVDTISEADADDTLFYTYSVICEAIRLKQRVRYSTKYMHYNKETQTVSARTNCGDIFTPKSIEQVNGELYMVGYLNRTKKIRAVNLRDIVNIDLSLSHKKERRAEIQSVLDKVDPREYVPGKRETVVYKGKVTFYCRASLVGEVYSKFGPPTEPVTKDVRGRTTYTVSDAVITSKTLHRLEGVRNHGIRLIGPDALLKSVRRYYTAQTDVITSDRLPWCDRE